MASAAASGPLAACLQPLAGLPPPDLTLPALEPVKNRETYRERPQNELEEAIWYSAEEPDTLVEPTLTRLRSIHSKQATVITFSNKSAFHVRALWIDFSGNEVVYSVLEPNSTRRYHTYQTHPWIVRELHTGTRMLMSECPAVVGLSAEQTVEIQAPPQLEWSLDTFGCFPESYKASVRGLLLAHKRMEEHAQCMAAVASLQPLKLTPPCSPAGKVPCSPRATLLHQGSLPTSPKAPRLSVSPMLMPMSPRTPGAMALAGSPAGVSEVPSTSTSTTSISISSEASHFKATLTVCSPTRAMLKQTVNIEVFNSPINGPLASNTAATLNLGAQPLEAAAAAPGPSHCTDAMAAAAVAPARPGGTSGKKAFRPKSGLFNSLVHTFKHAFKAPVRQLPSPQQSSTSQATSTTHITLHLSQLLPAAGAEAAADYMEVDTPEPAGPWPPVGTHLGHLPSHLLATIAEMAAPVTWQTLDQTPKGRPDIRPTMLACPPKTAKEEAAEQAQQQVDADGNANGDDDDMPALL